MIKIMKKAKFFEDFYVVIFSAMKVTNENRSQESFIWIIIVSGKTFSIFI